MARDENRRNVKHICMSLTVALYARCGNFAGQIDRFESTNIVLALLRFGARVVGKGVARDVCVPHCEVSKRCETDGCVG